jgi:DNA-binding NtrC family response regulator
MTDGKFRRDLYFRIAVIDIEIPSLNQRPEDILPIARYFLFEFAKNFGKSFTRISPETESLLLKRQYTGNARELKNIIEREVLLSDGPELEISRPALDNSHAGEPTDSGADGLPALTREGIDLAVIMKQIEKQYMETAMHLTGGNETRAAELLGYSRDTFRYRRRNHIGDS